jgi:gamma-glutamyl:cysteine ligase YbdK (ATP-grasp superfamily)
MIVDQLNINERTAHQTGTQDLNMRYICAKTVPNHYNDDQKACQKEAFAEMLEQLKTEPDFLLLGS